MGLGDCLLLNVYFLDVDKTNTFKIGKRHFQQVCSASGLEHLDHLYLAFCFMGMNLYQREKMFHLPMKM